jgi:Fe-S-cluster containining protein
MPGEAPDDRFPDCRACGACCTARAPHVRVLGDDHARLGDDADALTVWHGHRAYLRVRPDGDCVALVREPAENRVTCGIYDRRPDLCRALERGSPACEAELARKRPELLRATPRTR